MAVSGVTQRQIVWLNWKFPYETGLKPHPAIVISDSELLNEEGMFYAVLISSQNIHSNYTLEFTNDDLLGEDKLDHDSYVVTHFITYFELDDVERVMNAHVREEKFEEIQTKIIKSVMCLDVDYE